MTLFDSIVSIPNILKKLNNDFENIEQIGILQKRFNKVIFVGSGSSNNAINACRSFYEDECNLDLEVYYPNTFLNYKQNYEEALYVFISQGGETKLVYQGLEKVKDLGYTTVCITENVNSSIAAISDCTIDLKTGVEEYMFRTIGYSNTIVRCIQLAIKLSGLDYDKYQKDLDQAIDNLEMIRNKTVDWFENNESELLETDVYYFAGENYLYDICMEADIKFMEMVPVLTRSFELEEFIHGPQNSFNNKIAYFLLVDKSDADIKVIQIARYLKDKFGKAYVVGDKGIDKVDIDFTYKSQFFKQLEIITVFQVIAYLLANARGRDLKVSLNSDINKYIRKLL